MKRSLPVPEPEPNPEPEPLPKPLPLPRPEPSLVPWPAEYLSWVSSWIFRLMVSMGGTLRTMEP